LALVLGAYVYFVELPAAESEARVQAKSKLLPSFDAAKGTIVEITRSNQVIRAELRNAQWQMVNPPYPAQPTAIESFLALLQNLDRESEIPAQEIISESGGLSPFGLDPPLAVIRVQAGTNLVQLRVGAKTLLGDRVYVQPVGASNIYLTSASLLQHLPTTSTQWRNPLLVLNRSLVFDQIVIAGATALKLERDSSSQLWRLVDPIKSRADFARVEYLIQQLRSTRVNRFVSDDANEDLERYGLQTPEAELTLASGSNVVLRIQFGKSPTNDPAQVYARRLNQTNVVLVSRELVDLVEKPYTEFQDRALLSFRPALVQRIEARADETFALQRQGTNDWQIVEPFQAPADRQLMQLFLDDLSRLEIIRFEKDVVTDFAPYGLVKPSRQYVLKTTVTNAVGLTNQTLVQVDFGSQPTNEFDKVFCRRTDESSVYITSFGDMGRLERAAYALRDRRLWTFDPASVVAINVTQRGQKRAPFNRDPLTKAWVKNDAIVNAALEEIVHRLSEMQVEDWVAQGLDQAKQLKADGSELELVLDLAEPGKTRKPLNLNLRLGKPYGSTVLEQNQLVVFRMPVSLYGYILQYLTIPTPSSEL
jgi:hypothetical protein